MSTQTTSAAAGNTTETNTSATLDPTVAPALSLSPKSSIMALYSLIASIYNQMSKSEQSLFQSQLNMSYQLMGQYAQDTRDSGTYTRRSTLFQAASSFSDAALTGLQVGVSTFSPTGKDLNKQCEDASKLTSGLEKLQGNLNNHAGPHIGDAPAPEAQPAATPAYVNTIKNALSKTPPDFKGLVQDPNFNNFKPEDYREATATLGTSLPTIKNQLSDQIDTAKRDENTKQLKLQDYKNGWNNYKELGKGVSNSATISGQGIESAKAKNSDADGIEDSGAQKFANDSVDQIKQFLESYYQKLASAMSQQGQFANSGMRG